MLSIVSCICLTTHPKRVKFLPDAISSYRAQEYPNKELVIINDGDPLPRIDGALVINLPKRENRWTIGEKRNAGVRMARGEFIATWDDDDISLPNRLSEQVAYAAANDGDYVMADRMHISDENMKIIGDCTRKSVTVKPVMPSALIRRSMIVRAGGYEALDYLEDMNILEKIRLLHRGNILVIPNSNFYVMRRHGNNVTLGFGESTDEYAMCGMRGKYEIEAQRKVDAIRKSGIAI